MESVKRHDKLLASPYTSPHNIFIKRQKKREREGKTERDFRSEEIFLYIFCAINKLIKCYMLQWAFLWQYGYGAGHFILLWVHALFF